ncbi:MAG: sigma-70 family RNA polymerase sigma factor [Bryobacteraceae bacterium]|nr:sigma-70 family RNA polymerase sigma factor [Bryobacteraceae bacterium]
MAEPFPTPAIPLPGRLSGEETDSSRCTELEIEVVGLFDRMRVRILRYALSFGLPIPDAEEVVQDVFLALYQHLSSGKCRDGQSQDGHSQNGWSGWLFRVTHNLSLKRRSAISRTAVELMTPGAEGISSLVADPQPNPEDQFAFRQRRGRLRSVVDALPPLDRQCLYLRAEGFRYREIADVLGISLGSVANSLARSLSRLSTADERLG